MNDDSDIKLSLVGWSLQLVFGLVLCGSTRGFLMF